MLNPSRKKGTNGNGGVGKQTETVENTQQATARLCSCYNGVHGTNGCSGYCTNVLGPDEEFVCSGCLTRCNWVEYQ
jgi:hypothetical protein